MFNLIRNENMKTYRRARTWVMVALLLLVCFLVSFVSRYDKSSPGNPNRDWRAETQQQVRQLEPQLQDKDLSKPMRERIQQDVTLKKYQLEHNVPPVEATVWEGVQRVSSLVIMVTLFTVIVAADAVAAEFTWGTIKLLLIRPASRTKILLSKYISTMLFALFLLAVLFAGSIVINAILYGFEGMTAPSLKPDAGGAVREGVLMLDVLASYGLKAVELVMVVTLAFMISSVFRSSSLAIGISVFIQLTGQTIAMLLMRWSWGKYFLFANTDLTPYLSGQSLAEGMTPLFSIAVLLVYFALFNALSWLSFTRRDVAA